MLGFMFNGYRTEKRFLISRMYYNTIERPFFKFTGAIVFGLTKKKLVV